MTRLSDAEKARRAADRETARQEQMRAWARKQAEKAPPLTERQVRAVAAVLDAGRRDQETSQPPG